MTADGRRGEFLTDLLRNTILEFRMPFEEPDELMVNRGHSGIHFERERIPVLDPTLQPGTRQGSGAQIAEKGRRFYFVSIRVKDDFSDRLGFLFCFLSGHFDMFGHNLFPFRGSFTHVS